MIKRRLHSSLVLGSSSPRRKQLISSFQIPFRVLDPVLDEPDPYFNELPYIYCERMALLKYESVKHLLTPSEILLTADTVVSLRDEIFGKPKNPFEAEYMLKALRGTFHEVSTAIVLFSPSDNKLQKKICTTNVLMRDYSDLEIADYIDSGDYLDKAGSYSIQNKSFQLYREINGCYTSVVGLPLCDLSSMLIKEKFKVSEIICNEGLDNENTLWV